MVGFCFDDYSGVRTCKKNHLEEDYLVRSNLERFPYDLKMKKREQNRDNKRTEIERFDWFIERIQTLVAFGWLSERSDEKTSCPRTF